MTQKGFRNILDCESAVSEIIAAIMLLAIAVSMIALIQTESVPEWNKAIEMDHYNVVYEDFLKIRSDIEDVALFQFPKSSVIHMGAHYPDRLIFINPVGTSGTITSNDVWINVSYTNSTGNNTYYNFSSTSIKFEPNYNYYSNAASLVYEHGLVIKDFTDNNYLYTDTDQDIISGNTINIVNLSYPLESASFSDIKTINYNPESIYSDENITNVTVTFYTNYPLLWKELFKKYTFSSDVADNNTLKFNIPDNFSIKAYAINGSIASGTGVSIIPTSTATPTPTPTYSYVSIYDMLNITGNVTDFPAARNADDGGASAVLTESLVENMPDSENYSYVTSNITTNGTITNFVNMRNSTDSGAFANLTEGHALTNQSNRTMNPAKLITIGTQSGSYAPSNLTSIDGTIDITIPGVS